MGSKIFLAALLISSSLGISAFAMGRPKPQLPLETVGHVDLRRYTGVWYEIARLPQKFEKSCVGVTATYEINSDGNLDVLNSCRVDSLGGRLKTARGTAKVVDAQSNAKLKVTFFWPFYGDYWILELGPNFEYSVVGSPDRAYFWILSRTPSLPNTIVNGILTRFSAKAFDLSGIYRTPQE